MSTVKSMPGKAQRPRIKRRGEKVVGNTTATIYTGTLRATRRGVDLSYYKDWLDLPSKGAFMRELLETIYPTSGKLAGLSPSKRKKYRLELFMTSLRVMYHNIYGINKEAQAYAQAS